jgi:hypothetical protein
MSSPNQPPPTHKIERLVFIPQSEEENHLAQTIKQYAALEETQIHDLLLEALLHLVTQRDLFKSAKLGKLQKQKCCMRNCKNPAVFEAHYKQDNTLKLLCYCHGRQIESILKGGYNNHLWTYIKPLTVETAPPANIAVASTEATLVSEVHYR